MKSASTFSNGRSKEWGNLALIYQHFWNANIQFKDGIKHAFVINNLSFSSRRRSSQQKQRSLKNLATPKSKLLSDWVLIIYYRLRQRLPPQLMVQKSDKPSMSACARANPLPLRSPAANMHLKDAFVKCKFAGCKSANITRVLNYGRQASQGIPKLSISGRRETKPAGVTADVEGFHFMYVSG